MTLIVFAVLWLGWFSLFSDKKNILETNDEMFSIAGYFAIISLLFMHVSFWEFISFDAIFASMPNYELMAVFVPIVIIDWIFKRQSQNA